MPKPRRAPERSPRKARAPKVARAASPPLESPEGPAPPVEVAAKPKARGASKRRRTSKNPDTPPSIPAATIAIADEPAASSELDDELKAAKQILDSISWTKLAAAGRSLEPSQPPIEPHLVEQSDLAATPAIPAVDLVAEPETFFDPFAHALADEPPFDAPSEHELEHAIADIEAETETASEQFASVAPILMPIRPIRAYSASASSNPAYLESARRAAQEQVRVAEQRPWLARVREEGRLIASVAVGLAAPLLLFAAANALRGPQTESDAPIIGSAANAAEPSPAVADEADTYAVALQRLSEGRLSEGEALLRRAAERGHVLAQYRLAKFYERGESGQRDLASARAWTERAAIGGNCRAMHDLGVFFARGEIAPVDDTAAFRWFRQAAEFGVADSQFNLGVLYAQGRGVAANAEEALFWFLVASRHRDLDAVDRAVDLAAQLEPAQVARARTRARAFTARPANAAVNLEDCAQTA